MFANNPLKLNNVINTCLINPNVTLYCSFLLNIYEYLEHYQHQYYYNQPKNDTHIHLVSLRHISN